MRAPCSLLGALAAVALASACDRPDPLVICHNGNCAATGDPADDDTMSALRASLALRWRGRPTIDGVEVDTMWYRPTATCLFTHDPGDAPDTAVELADAIAAHLREPDVAWNGDRFYTIIELKPYVEGRFDLHTPAEAAAHADCVLDLYDQLVAAAADGNHQLQVVFESISPDLLDALVARPRWPGWLDGDVEVRLAGESGTYLQPLADYDVPLDIIEYPAGWPTDAQMEAYASTGASLCMWNYTLTPEAFASIRQWEPRYVLTGEATALRRWLED